MGSNKGGVRREDVAEAAEACFVRFGVRRTSMADVAEALGVARATVYRLFESRTALLEFIASKHIVDLAKQLQARFAAFSTLEEALIEGSVISVESGVSDPLLAEIFEHNADHGFEQFLFRGTPEVREIMLNLWRPLLETARAAGRLHPRINNERAVEWIRNVHVVATMRDDYGVEEMRALFRDFLVRSLVLSEFPISSTID